MALRGGWAGKGSPRSRREAHSMSRAHREHDPVSRLRHGSRILSPPPRSAGTGEVRRHGVPAPLPVVPLGNARQRVVDTPSPGVTRPHTAPGSGSLTHRWGSCALVRRSSAINDHLIGASFGRSRRSAQDGNTFTRGSGPSSPVGGGAEGPEHSPPSRRRPRRSPWGARRRDVVVHTGGECGRKSVEAGRPTPTLDALHQVRGSLGEPLSPHSTSRTRPPVRTGRSSATPPDRPGRR